jgi:hypothetical protein
VSWVIPALVLLGIAPTPSQASQPAVFALVVGVNRSVDTQLAPLVYADDDAFRYRDLFRSVGARTWLLARPDENTRRVSAAVAEAQEPAAESLTRAVSELARAVASARAQGRRTVLYFVFAGHGNLGESGAYLTLEDQRLTGAELDRQVLRPIGADESHLIVDACYSYYLANERGPGGRARDVRGFSQLGGQLDRPDVGVLLSTSSARESHEWQEFQAGVFSHEVRSGLYGAADANGDGEVSYLEIAAFVSWANAAIANERFRPEVFARAPRGQARLLDLRPALANRIVVDALVEPGHHLVEDRQGNRVAEFHNPAGQTVRLVRPAAELLFVRHLGNGQEYEIVPGAGEQKLGDLARRPAPLRTRGAASHAFSRIFSLPFDRWVVDEFDDGKAETRLKAGAVPAGGNWYRPVAIGSFGTALVSGVAAAWMIRSTRALEREAEVADQRRAASLNDRIESRRHAAAAFGVASLATAAAGVVLWLWPAAPAVPAVAAQPGSPVLLGASGRF